MIASVLILIHDEDLPHIKNCLSSIINQKFTEFEIVIIDDSEKEENLKYFENLKSNNINIKYFKFQEKMSLPDARNLGISKCVGKYVFLQDSDDWSQPNRIEIQVKYLENGVDICCGLTNYFNSKSQYIFTSKQKKELKRVDDKNIIHNNHVAIGSVAFKRDIFSQEYEIFRKELKHCDDMDFVLRNSRKFKFFQINKVIYNYRFNKKSSTLNTNDKLQPFLDFYTLQQMYKENNFKIDHIKKKIIDNKKNYIIKKNTKQRISYMIYSGNYLQAYKESNDIKLKFYAILLVIKVNLLILKNKI